VPATPRGYPYPDSGGHTRLWEHLAALAAAVDADVAAQVAYLDRLKLAKWHDSTAFANVTRSDGVEVALVTLAIADPGYTYRLHVEAGVTAFINAGNAVRFRLRLGSTTGTVLGAPAIEDTTGHSGTPGATVPLVGRRSAALTGATSVLVTGQRYVGSGSWNAPGTDSWVMATVEPWVA
jgi:hypothetical protein